MRINFDLQRPFDYFEKALLFSELTSEGGKLARNSYAHASRSYHGINHIGFLWYCFNELRFSGNASDSVRMSHLAANFFVCHDVIMKRGRGESEKASAQFWMDHNVVQGSSAENLTQSTILASADHLADRPTDSNDPWIDWLLGIDLIPLAAPEETFHLNTCMLRAEHHYLSDAEWDAGRRAFLTKINKAPVIYRDPYLHSLFEAPARHNIQRALG